MPMVKVNCSEAITKQEFHRRLKQWLDETDESRIDGDGAYNQTPWIYIKGERGLCELNADSSRKGVTEYLALVEKHGSDIEWLIVRNARGVENKLAFVSKEGIVPGFYLYVA